MQGQNPFSTMSTRNEVEVFHIGTMQIQDIALNVVDHALESG